MTDESRLLLFRDDVDVTAGIWRQGLPRMTVPTAIAASCKHFLCWLHPGRSPAFVALLHNGAVVYVDARADVHGAGGPANGYFEYMHREGDGDVLFLHFSSRGIPEAMRSTVLRRVDGSAVWRASMGVLFGAMFRL